MPQADEKEKKKKMEKIERLLQSNEIQTPHAKKKDFTQRVSITVCVIIFLHFGVDILWELTACINLPIYLPTKKARLDTTLVSMINKALHKLHEVFKAHRRKNNDHISIKSLKQDFKGEGRIHNPTKV